MNIYSFDAIWLEWAELRRVGCNTIAVDGNWNAALERALDLFNKHAGLKLNMTTANADALDAVKPTEALAAKVTRLTEKLTKLKEEMGKLAVYEKQMLASPDQQISLTDPDSRSFTYRGEVVYPDLEREHAAYEYVKQHGAQVTSLHVAMNSMVKPDADFFLETRIA